MGETGETGATGQMRGEVIRWGICTTLKATPDKVLAFVAHHLSLGATRIWLHFDDPDDPAAAMVEALPQVTVIRCDADWWAARNGRRPPKHQTRQSCNIQYLCDTAPLPWIAHIDVDEFLWPARPIATLLAGQPKEAPMMRLRPWEALHDPSLTDDIYTARAFRAAMNGAQLAALRAEIFGDYAPLFPQGVLSHAAGKCFFRTGIAGLQPRIHGALLGKTRIGGLPFQQGIELLHFHAQDRADWLSRLAFRLDRGAYIGKPELFAYLKLASPAEIDAFYDATQVATPELLERLQRHGQLLEADLGLLARVAALPVLAAAALPDSLVDKPPIRAVADPNGAPKPPSE